MAAQGNVLRTVTDHIDAAIFQVDAVDTIVFVNPAVERLFGWPTADLHGRPLHDTLYDSRPDGRTLAAGDSPLADVLRSGHAVRDFETVFFRRDGSPLHVVCSHTPILVEGAVVGAVMAVQDVSRRKEAEDVIRAEVRRYEALALLQGEVDAAAADLDQILAAVVSGAGKVLPQADGAVAALLQGDDLVYRAVSGPDQGEIGLKVALDQSLAGLSLRTGRPLLCEDAFADPRADATLARRLGIRSAITVPIPSHGALVGVLMVVAKAPGAFGPNDIMIAQVLVGHIATGLARIDEAEALRDMRRSEERLQLALQASETIGIWDWDVENDLCYADPRFARLFAVDPAQAAQGLPIARLRGRASIRTTGSGS